MQQAASIQAAHLFVFRVVGGGAIQLRLDGVKWSGGERPCNTKQEGVRRHTKAFTAQQPTWSCFETILGLKREKERQAQPCLL